MLDVGLGKRDVLDLANADAVAGFFGRLGYRTEARNAQAAANLGLPADVERLIRRMELLADQEFFQVWLFELTSITVQTTRRIAMAFRNRPSGRFLMVLTTPDYDRLDFVLVELVAPDPVSPAKQVLVRPRVLTVDRRDPKPLQLRVLRRLTFTEGDGFGQYDKLLSAYGAAEWSTDLFNNRALFSDYYLQERLPETGTPQDRQTLLVEFRRLFDRARQRLGGKKEAETRADLLIPALRALGFDAREGKAPGDASTTADYRLYAPGGSKPLAFCLTYPWGRSLDGPDGIRDAESSDENPGAVVVSLLEVGEAPWAIVTNGKLWRLYAAAAHSRATNYFEIDLDETLASASALDGFKIFSLLFCRTAFELRPTKIEGQERRLSYLDQALLDSQKYAKELGERLKNRVFEEIFGHLAEGFVQAIRTAEGRRVDLSDERLQEVFEGTLTLLYRLLFLFYAESRDLLPVRETRGYWEKSLTRLCDEVAERAGRLRDQAAKRIDAVFASSSTALYDRLSDLFRVIAAGDRDLNVPLYNGGLFQVDPDTTDTSPEARNARFLST